MVAICPDFKWLGFRISDPIWNPDHLNPTSFGPLKIQSRSDFRAGMLSKITVFVRTDGLFVRFLNGPSHVTGRWFENWTKSPDLGHLHFNFWRVFEQSKNLTIQWRTIWIPNYSGNQIITVWLAQEVSIGFLWIFFMPFSYSGVY